MTGYKCICRCCTSENKDIVFFSLPTDSSRRESWLKAAKREDLKEKTNFKNYRICRKHFKDEFISTGGKLFCNARPTLFCNHVCELVSNEVSEEPPRKIIILSDVRLPSKETNLKTTVAQRNLETSAMGSMDVDVEENSYSYSSSGQKMDSCSQTPYSLTQNTPRKVKLRYQIRSFKRNIKRKNQLFNTQEDNSQLESFEKLFDKVLNKPLAEIVKVQAKLKNKSGRAKRYNNEYKQFALTLYFLGPKVYRFLEKILLLPTKRTLERMTQKVSTKPGCNQYAFDCIARKVKTMSELDKYCTICIDETSLMSNLYFNLSRDEIVGFEDTGKEKKDTKVAQNVAAVMARGLFHNWKQPIAYFFVNTQLKSSEVCTILGEIIQKLSDAGLFVQGVVSDMGSNFIQLANMLNVTPENPEFQLGNFSLIYFFDPPHLMKATKNNLSRSSFHFEDKKTSWNFIEQFYHEDKKHPYRCAPKLTDSHIYPNNFEKMKVKLSVQVLSHTVASGMYTYMSLGALPGEALRTIEIIEKFNKLFDLLNSIDTTHPNIYKTAFQGLEFQISFLNEMWLFLNNLKIYNNDGKDITNKCKFRTSWMVTIKGIQVLWKRLAKAGFTYLKTRRVNQDCLENYFGNIRQQGGNSVNPTPIQFERAHRKIFCQSFLDSQHMNCENDLAVLLADLKHFSNSNEINTSATVESVGAINVSERDYRELNLTTQNAFNYVCGYLIKKALNVHSCDICIHFAKESNELKNSNLLTHFKAYDLKTNVYGNLKTPSEFFLYSIYQLENLFLSLFDVLSAKSGISKAYFAEMNKIDFNHPCTQFDKSYVIKLFIRPQKNQTKPTEN